MGAIASPSVRKLAAERGVDIDALAQKLGRETIARAHNLGGVKHILVGFTVSDAPAGAPPRGAELFAPGVDKAAGELTSIAGSPTLGQMVGLGYVRVAHQAEGTALRAVWSNGEADVVVRALPLV